MRSIPVLLLSSCCAFALAAPLAGQDDRARVIENGGITVAGWAGKIDAREAAAGQVLDNARFSGSDAEISVETGPATTYWRTDAMATGSYTVSATFHEPEYMNVNDHPHPYGIVIGGNDMGTDDQSLLYCAAYGNGTFIVRGFGPEPFQLGGRRATANDAVHQAAGRNQPVTQEIAVTVTADAVSCSINGTEVASFPRSEVVTEGRLTSTDGRYGVRFAHNTDAVVRGLTLTQH